MTARADLLNLMAQWGCTTGKGSRPIANQIMDDHLRELVTAVRSTADSLLYRQEITRAEHTAMMRTTTILLSTSHWGGGRS